MNKAVFLLSLIALCTSAIANPEAITAEEWAQPRNGDVLINHAALSNAVSTILEEPDALLEIRYPGGDEGNVWALEVRAWLIALGIASNRIELVPGSSAPDVLELQIRL
ncbi:hypothetical protein [Thiohalomonas denitrificans]|uniref:Uncharacterized protein n=1 Tax=Thiohalomonas denitrificans TaxID=415747 RepID=A0A1G5PM93_9GAMM|nr:hypothetical protein [Thiohalomonas denitrificans]SCZ50675.1 hypothetical protein SAMN03097708_00471 [Thiohalomonas denitrificans]